MLWLLKRTHPLVLAVREGQVRCEKGRLPQRTLLEIQQVLEDVDVSRGTIHMAGNGRFGFSASIPRDRHQKLRNVLTSH
ncbi:MAG: DUF3634 family protein [Haloferula sp.]